VKPPDPMIMGPRTVPAEPERRPYARFLPSEPVRVPAGCFEARVWAPGFTVSDWVPVERLGSVAMARSGTLVVAVQEQGKPAIARIQVRGVGKTRDPDWGEDPDDGAALNVAHVRNGALTRPVPPGRYRVIADRGFEYSVADVLVDVEADQRAYVSVQIERVVDSSGWVSADLHLHASPSPDAPQSLEERVLSLVAGGVEVGVATDHNRVTDYAPTIEALGLRGRVASIAGDEVTTEEMPFGHFNVFPLESGSPALVYKRTYPQAVFAEARSRRPLLGRTLLQVNHPRMGDIGYFDVTRMDRDDIGAFTKRTPWASLDFDAIEVYNGDDAVSVAQVRQVMKDWLALIDAGYRSTATGNSDSHRAVFHEPGLPRTYVAMKSESLDPFDQAAFVEALHQGRAFVSGGPFLRFDIGGAGIGDVVAPGIRDAHVTVDAPPWMEITYVEIIQKGKPGVRIEGPFAAGAHAAEVTTSVDLRPGDWIIAIAGGSRDMDPLFRRGVVPFSFTNPIYVAP